MKRPEEKDYIAKHIYYFDLNKYIDWLESKQNVIDRFEDKEFIHNVCLSYRHDFGLLDEQQRLMEINECEQWMRAIKNNAPYQCSNNCGYFEG